MPTLPPYGKRPALKHLIDWIKDWEGDFDWDVICGHLQQKAVGQLPDPFKPKATSAVGVKMNVVILKHPEQRRYDILKYYVFDDKVSMETAVAMCHGEAMTANWGGLNKAGPRAFKFLFMRFVYCDYIPHTQMILFSNNIVY